MSVAVGHVRRCFAVWPSFFSLPPGIALAKYTSRKDRTMTKSIDAITEIVRNPKNSFRKADDRPAKAQKHRYERRKIKEYLRVSDWGQEETA